VVQVLTRSKRIDADNAHRISVRDRSLE